MAPTNGAFMPVQRKVFRIEQHMRPRARGAMSVAKTGAQHGEFASALRALVEPQTPSDREALARLRAEIPEAQAYKAELRVYPSRPQRRMRRGDYGAYNSCRADSTRSRNWRSRCNWRCTLSTL